MADDTEGAIPDDEAQDVQQDQSEDQGQSPAIPESGEQPETLGGDRPWYAQDNGMLPINAAASAGKAAIGGGKRILHYLMGADSADPEVASKFTQGVKAEHPGISDDDANVVAVHKAAEMGGPAAGWAMIQYNRSAYDRKQAFAKAALNGIDGKAGDLQAAANAASQASQNILDGSTAQFTADPGSGFVTATVKPPGSDQAENYTLTPQQFDQYLDIGGAGQWDHVMQGGGVAGTLQKIVGTTKEKPSASVVDLSAGGNSAEPQPDEATKENMKRDFVDLSGGDNDYTDWNNRLNGKNPEGFTTIGHGVASSTSSADDDDVRRRAMQLYPSVSQGAARNQYMASETARGDELENKRQIAEGQERARLGVAKENAKGRVGAANVNADARVKSAEIRSKAAMANANLLASKIISQAKNQADRERGLNMRAEINAIARTANPGDDISGAVQKVLQRYNADPTTAPASPAPAPPTSVNTAPPAANAPAQNAHSVPPVGQRVTGQVYQTPKGSFRWMGNGWQRAQ